MNDCLSKCAHFIALQSHSTALFVATIFVLEICRLHEIPRTIISTHDSIFMSKFWTELFHLSGATLNHSNAKRLESNGQIEIINRVLEQYLRCFVMDSPSKWLKFLPRAKFSYNTGKHTSTSFSPFQIAYG